MIGQRSSKIIHGQFLLETLLLKYLITVCSAFILANTCISCTRHPILYYTSYKPIVRASFLYIYIYINNSFLYNNNFVHIGLCATYGARAHVAVVRRAIDDFSSVGQPVINRPIDLPHSEIYNLIKSFNNYYDNHMHADMIYCSLDAAGSQRTRKRKT